MPPQVLAAAAVLPTLHGLPGVDTVAESRKPQHEIRADFRVIARMGHRKLSHMSEK